MRNAFMRVFRADCCFWNQCRPESTCTNVTAQAYFVDDDRSLAGATASLSPCHDSLSLSPCHDNEQGATAASTFCTHQQVEINSIKCLRDCDYSLYMLIYTPILSCALVCFAKQYKSNNHYNYMAADSIMCGNVVKRNVEFVSDTRWINKSGSMPDLAAFLKR